MKKIFILFFCIILLSGCSKKEKKIIKENKQPEIIEKEPEYKDENPVKISFYENNKKLKDFSTSRKLIKPYY